MGKKLKINIPSGLDDVTLGQFMNYASLVEGIEDTNRLNEIAIMSLCEVPMEHIRLLSAKQVDEILLKLSNVLEEIDKPQPFVKRFKLKGIEFGFVPDLDNITYGENKDITAHIQAGNLNKAMAVLYRPVKETFKDTYSIEKYEPSTTRQMWFRDMPVGIYLGANVFFWTLIKELLSHIPNYLESQMEEEMYKELIQKVYTRPIGGGMMNFTI